MGHGISRPRKGSSNSTNCFDKSISVDGNSGPQRALAVEEILFDRRLLTAEKRTQLEECFSWGHCSENIVVESDAPCKFHRFPVAQRTDLARGRLAMKKGVHVWKFNWSPKQRGTHAVVGVCTENTPLHCNGYTHLVGSTKTSWGWDLVKHGLHHNGKRSRYNYPAEIKLDEVGPTIIMIVDMDKGTLAYEVNGMPLGMAFSNLQGHTLYPAVSSVWGNCGVELKYLGSAFPYEVSPLVTLARNAVRRSVGRERIADGGVDQLCLPDILKFYVACRLPVVAYTASEQQFDIDNNWQPVEVQSKGQFSAQVLPDTQESSADGGVAGASRLPTGSRDACEACLPLSASMNALQSDGEKPCSSLTTSSTSIPGLESSSRQQDLLMDRKPSHSSIDVDPPEPHRLPMFKASTMHNDALPAVPGTVPGAPTVITPPPSMGDHDSLFGVEAFYFSHEKSTNTATSLHQKPPATSAHQKPPVAPVHSFSVTGLHGRQHLRQLSRDGGGHSGLAPFVPQLTQAQ